MVTFMGDNQMNPPSIGSRELGIGGSSIRLAWWNLSSIPAGTNNHFHQLMNQQSATISNLPTGMAWTTTFKYSENPIYEMYNPTFHHQFSNQLSLIATAITAGAERQGSSELDDQDSGEGSTCQKWPRNDPDVTRNKERPDSYVYKYIYIYNMYIHAVTPEKIDTVSHA